MAQTRDDGSDAASEVGSRWPRPAAGDVVVANTTATLEYSITIMPGSLREHCPTRTIALDRARELARELQVDVWLTEDQTHFIRIASNLSCASG